MSPEDFTKLVYKTAKKKAKTAGKVTDNGTREKLLNLLEERQRTDGSLSEASLSGIAGDLNLPLSEVYGVASFYAFLSTKPQGKNVIRICKSLPCYLKNAPMIMESVSQNIGIKPGQTTADGRFSFELTNCIGACDEAPAMLINDKVHGSLTPGKIADILKSYREGR